MGKDTVTEKIAQEENKQEEERYPQYEAVDDWSIPDEDAAADEDGENQQVKEEAVGSYNLEEVLKEYTKKNYWEDDLPGIAQHCASKMDHQVRVQEKGLENEQKTQKEQKKHKILLVSSVIAIAFFAVAIIGFNKNDSPVDNKGTQHCIYLKDGDLMYTAVDGVTKRLEKDYADGVEGICTQTIYCEQEGQYKMVPVISDTIFENMVRIVGSDAFYIKNVKYMNQRDQIEADLIYVNLHTLQRKKLDHIIFESASIKSDIHNGFSLNNLCQVPFVTTKTSNGIALIYSNQKGMYLNNLTEKRLIGLPTYRMFVYKNNPMMLTMDKAGYKTYVDRRTGSLDSNVQKNEVFIYGDQDDPLTIWFCEDGKLHYHKCGQSKSYETEIPYDESYLYRFHKDGTCHYLVRKELRLPMKDYIDVNTIEDSLIRKKIIEGEYDLTYQVYEVCYWDKKNIKVVGQNIIKELETGSGVYKPNSKEYLVQLAFNSLYQVKENPLEQKEIKEEEVEEYKKQLAIKLEYILFCVTGDTTYNMPIDGIYESLIDHMYVTEDGEWLSIWGDSRQGKMLALFHVLDAKVNVLPMQTEEFLRCDTEGVFWVKDENGLYYLYQNDQIILSGQKYSSNVVRDSLDHRYDLYRVDDVPVDLETSSQTRDYVSRYYSLYVYDHNINKKVFQEDKVVNSKHFGTGHIYYTKQISTDDSTRYELYYYFGEEKNGLLEKNVTNFVIDQESRGF